AAVGFILCFVSGVKVKYLSGLILAGFPLIYALITGVGYRKRRMLAFLDPWADPQGSGFQIIQSFLALGNGGLFGTGLGRSRQKLFYLPQSHTDFIFSIIGEELGFIGAGLVVMLFAAFTILAVRIAFTAREPFGRFLAVGVLSIISLSSLINMGVCIGALPTKGLPLPFLSYGGTALLANLFGVGILLNISKNRDVMPVSQ
ncbi:MAG: FtsW/RodA/SpoVE family cell cycle protein, partial [Candidatus Omnitrophica bacterium]|nr:FtsW/RodA/SpoVE family cell cycle protein [Candidatus Omnitrophota bacterium]